MDSEKEYNNWGESPKYYIENDWRLADGIYKGITTDLHGIQRKSPSAVSLQQKGDVHKYKSIYLPNILFD